MKNKNKEEIKQSKRTLQFLKTLQVTVVDFVINTKHSYRFQLDEVRKPPAYTVQHIPACHVQCVAGFYWLFMQKTRILSA